MVADQHEKVETLQRIAFDVHVEHPGGRRIHAGDCVVEEDAGLVRRVSFRYTADYLGEPAAFPLDPGQLGLGPGERQFVCQGGVPGVIDDHLPDAWGLKVLATLARDRDARRLNVNSVIDLLTLAQERSHIGGLSLTLPGVRPQYSLGAPVESLHLAERAAVHVDAMVPDPDRDDCGIARLANAGSGVGGARPKALLTNGRQHYIAKFNRLSGDSYNNARVELACLNMARAAGLSVSRGHVVEHVNGREALLLERFDVAEDGARHHLITVNALLKEEGTQRDSGLPFRYDDVADLLRRYSVAIKADLGQLARLALFNRAINNTDDHARNFSFIHRVPGYRLAPAYDLVPSLAIGEYHAAGLGYEPRPPRLSQVSRMGRMFGLSKPWLRQCADQVADAVARWPEFADQAGVAESEADVVCSRFNP